MIFATVGTQLPFPRLFSALDKLAPDLGEEIIAQTGPNAGTWSNLELCEKLAPSDFEQLFSSARIVVAHAGVGSILSAKRHQRPLVILPRRYKLGEHRNDHQLATARQVEKLPGIYVAWEVDNLASLLKSSGLAAATEAQSSSHAALITRLQEFIATTKNR